MRLGLRIPTLGKCKSTRFNMPSHSRDAALAPVAPPAGQSRPARTHPCNVQRAMRCTLGIRPVLGLFFAAFLPGARASDLPPELGDLIDPAPKVYVYRMSEIGPSVTDAISLSLHWGRLEIADQGKPWNATDVVVDRSLPFRRLGLCCDPLRAWGQGTWLSYSCDITSK